MRQNVWTRARCESGACVEVMWLNGTHWLVRDTKNVDGPMLTFTNEEWAAFTGGMKNGEFDVK